MLKDEKFLNIEAAIKEWTVEDIKKSYHEVHEYDDKFRLTKVKQLDLSKEPYMAEERFISVSSTKSVTYIYPRILKDNSLLEYNMGEHSLHLFDEYFSLKNTLSHHIKELDECFFESVLI